MRSQLGGNRKAAHPNQLGPDSPRPATASAPAAPDAAPAAILSLSSGALVWAGQNRSPGRQFRTVNCSAKKSGTKKLLRDYTRNLASGSDAQRFDYSPQLRNHNAARDGQRIFVIRHGLAVPQVWRNEHHSLRLAHDLPAERKRQLFSCWTFFAPRTAKFLRCA